MSLHIYKKLNDAPVFEIGPSGRFQLTTLAAIGTQKQVHHKWTKWTHNFLNFMNILQLVHADRTVGLIEQTAFDSL